MQSGKDIKSGSLQSILSRRSLLKAAGAFAAATSVSEAFGQQTSPTGAPFGTIWLYISTYTSATGPSAFGSNGQGIYLCQLDLFTGQLTILGLAASALATPPTSLPSPSTIALDPNRTHLYAGNEFGPPGAVSAFSIDRATGALTPLNQQSAVGEPAYVGVDNSGKYLFSAEYSGGYFEVFPILGDGSLGPAVFHQFDGDNVGPKKAANGPPGSFAISAHEGPNGHPHMMQTDPSNQWVLGSDAGQDRIYVWKLNQGSSSPLTPAATPFTYVPQGTGPSGDGPRHFAFHPNGRWMYSIQEEASTIIYWHFNPATGVLTQQDMVSSLPPGFAGTDFTSEIRVSPDGLFVYGANRTNDTIGVFRVTGDGTLSQVSHASTLGDYPRIFAIDPFGLFAVVGNQRADNVTTFRISGGRLIFTGNYTPIGSPSGMVFLY